MCGSLLRYAQSLHPTLTSGMPSAYNTTGQTSPIPSRYVKSNNFNFYMILEGQIIKLRPMTVKEMSIFFEMATKSEATQFLYGEMCGDKIPTWEELFNDYKKYYFDGSQPEKGRCFAILLNDKIIGQVNYNDINRKNNSVELDIWIAKSSNTSRGCGSEALKTLMKYLYKELKIENFIICPSIENLRAIKAYQKAGFEIIETFIDDKGKENYKMMKSYSTSHNSV